MKLKEKLATMTADELEELADKFCNALEQKLNEFYDGQEEEPNIRPDACTICPFIDMCCLGHTGVVEALNEEV